MKLSFKHIATYLVAIVGLVVPTAFQASAATASIYLSASSTTAYNGATINVSVRMNSSSLVNAVQTNLSYPTDKLDYLSTSFSGSAFEIGAQSTGGAGTVQIGRGTLSSVSGNQLIATVAFRAKVASGSGTIAVATSSSLVNNGTEVPSTKGFLALSFAAVPVASTPVAPPTAPTTKQQVPSTPSTSTAVVTPAAPPPDTTAPTLTAITTSSTESNSITVKWTTNEAASSTVEYGLNTSYGLSVVNGEKVTEHTVVISSVLLLPKTAYHIRVSSIDAAGNAKQSDDIVATTKGLSLNVIITDINKQPLKDVSVTIDGTTLMTDEKGSAVFELAPGKKTILANIYGVSKTSSFVLGAATTNDTTVVLDAKAPIPWATLSLIPLLIGGIFIGHYVWRKRPAGKLPTLYGTKSLSDFASSLPDKARIIDITDTPSAFGREIAALRPDISWVNFIFAKQEIAKTDTPPNIHYVTGDLSNFHETTGYEIYDMVFTDWVWPSVSKENVDEPSKAVKTIFYAAKSNGTIAIKPWKGNYVYRITKELKLDADDFTATVMKASQTRGIARIVRTVQINIHSVFSTLAKK